MRWATPQLHDIDALAKMVDPVLNGMYPAKSLSRFADVIALCVQVKFFIENQKVPAVFIIKSPIVMTMRYTMGVLVHVCMFGGGW